MLYSLLAEKNELYQIAQKFQYEMVAQRISDEDIEFISSNLLPLIAKFSGYAADDEPNDQLDTIRSLLSPETVKILQLVGFNYRQAIGEPLTQVVAQLISTLGAGFAKQKASVTGTPKAIRR